MIIYDDSIQEGNEHFQVRLKSIDPFTYSGTASAKIVIAETAPETEPTVKESIAPSSKSFFNA